MTEPVLVPGLVALVDPVTGRFSDSLAPPSVAANTATAAAAATAAANAKTAAETAATAAASAKVAAEAALAATSAINADAVTVDNLGQATTLGKSLAKIPDATAGRTALLAVGKSDLSLNVRDYGAVGDGTTDDTAAIQAALDAAYAMGASWNSNVGRPTPRVYAHGIFKTTGTITIKTAVDFSQAVFKCYQTTGVAVQVNDPNGAPMFDNDIKLPQVACQVKPTPGWGTIAGTIGVRVTNLYHCTVLVGHITNFETGFCGHANGSNGTSYSSFTLGKIYGCKIAVALSPNSTGSSATSAWFNSNMFYGGTFGLSPAEGVAVAGTRICLISPSYWPVDDNKFYGMSLESANVVEYMIDCYGIYNYWERCRFENTGAPPRVLWRSSSSHNQITHTLGTEFITYTTESGAKNHGTATRLAAFQTSERPTSIGIGGLALDTTLSRPIFSPDGVTIKTLAAIDDLVLTLTGTGSPEGVITAPPGTFYTRTEVVNRTNGCKYPIASNVAATTGWSAGASGTLSVGSGYLRNTLVASAGGTSRGINSSNGITLPALPSSAYTINIGCRMSNPLPVQLRAIWYTAGGVVTGTQQLGATATPSSSGFTDLPPIVATSPSDAAFVLINVAINGGPANNAGDTIDVRRCMMEVNSTGNAYFDGSFTSTSEVTYGWSGSPGASTSTTTWAVIPISFVKTGSGNTGWRALAGADMIPAGGGGGSAPSLLPTGAIAETYDRRNGFGSLTLTSGQMALSPIYLQAGTTVTSATFASSSTPMAGGTHGWAALFTAGRVLLGQSADDTAITWPIQTPKTFTFAAPIVVPSTGWYYVAVMTTATTQPTLAGLVVVQGAAQIAPAVGGTSNTGLTGTAPSNAAATTGFAVPYAYVS